MGGDTIEATLRAVDRNVPVRTVSASRNKITRAEPISALYEQHRVHHVGGFAELEDEMCSYEPGTVASPDRLDALVWAMTDLMIDFEQSIGFHVPIVSHNPLGDVREIGLPGVLGPSIWGSNEKPGGWAAGEVSPLPDQLFVAGAQTMTTKDFAEALDRAQQALAVAQGDVASITQAAVQAPAGDPVIAGHMAAALDRVAAAQARVDAASACLPPPQAPVNDPLPPPDEQLPQSVGPGSWPSNRRSTPGRLQ
jgi:hypothetical protein